MALTASELYEAALALPPDARHDVALRLLDSLADADPTPAGQAWTAEISARVDDILAGTVQTIPAEQVFAELSARRAARGA